MKEVDYMEKLNCIFLIITLMIMFYSIYKDMINKNHNKKTSERKSVLYKKSKWICLIFVLISSVLYLYNLDYVPNGLNIDEAGTAYDAISLSKYGVDRYLYHNPVYFINFGGGQNALYTYLVTLLLKVFNYNLFVLRLPAAIFGILSILTFFLLIKNNKKDIKLAIVATSLMLITPFFIMKSRWSLESYLFLPMLLFSIYFLLKAINLNKNRYFLISGILFGITLYTYAISYLVLPIFLAITCIYGLITKNIKFKNLLFLGIPIIIFAIPLLLMLAVNNGYINEIVTKYISIPKLFFYRGGEISLNNIMRNLKNFNIFKIIFSTDNLFWNSIEEYGTLYYISIPIFIYGLIISIKNVIKVIKKKKINLDFIMLILLFASFFVGLLTAIVNINKLNSIYLPIIYFISVGLYQTIKNTKALSLIIIGMYLVLFICFANYYFVTYPKEYKDGSLFVSEDFNKSLDFAQKLKTNENKIFSPNVSYIYTLVHDKTSPYSFNKSMKMEGTDVLQYGDYIFKNSNLKLSDDIIYIIIKDDDTYKVLKKEKNYKFKRNGRFYVFYK